MKDSVKRQPLRLRNLQVVKFILASIVLFFLLVQCLIVSAQRPDNFYTYHTHLNYAESWEKYSRTGEYSDLVVVLDSGKLVFGRATSYLPVWEVGSISFPFPEMVIRKGDGTQKMPDRNNRFSHVRLIEESPEKIMVQWRYLPEFSWDDKLFRIKDVKQSDFVDEYFVIFNDGKIERKIYKGTAKIEDWMSPKKTTIQYLQINQQGLKVEGTNLPAKESGASIQNNLKTERDKDELNPVFQISFNEGKGHLVHEDISNMEFQVLGNDLLWRKGISGTCIELDGYHNGIEIPNKNLPDLKEGFIAEAWVALGAYPWNNTTVFDGGIWQLGIDADGFPFVNMDRITCKSEKKLDLYQWIQLAVEFNPQTKRIRLLINGEMDKEAFVEVTEIPASNLLIGINRYPKVASRMIRPKSNFPIITGIEGLLDEVRIYGLQGEKDATVLNSYSNLIKGKSVLNSEIQPYKLPEIKPFEKFSTKYVNLKLVDRWDNMWRVGSYPDIVVGFDKLPGHFVFWRGLSYIPALSNDQGIWLSNEFNETWNRTGGIGCMEPMSDKLGFYNYVRIIESSPARVIVHWRYPLIDVNQVFANFNEENQWSDWSDWYYVIYPDGIAAKRMRCWHDWTSPHEWQESMIISTGIHPEETVEKATMLQAAKLDGTEKIGDCSVGYPAEGFDMKGYAVHVVDLKGKLNSVLIGDIQKNSLYTGETTDYSLFPYWNHWPSAQIMSDGRQAINCDRLSHFSSTGSIIVPTTNQSKGDAPFEEKLMLEGLAEGRAVDHVSLAKSWMQPAKLVHLKGASGGNYLAEERCWSIRSENENEISFVLEANEKNPVVNPVFTVSDWKGNDRVKIIINNETPEDYRLGVVRDHSGKRKLVVWCSYGSEKPVIFKIVTLSNNN